MLFTGEFEFAIDPKQRLAIPAEIRSGLDPAVDGEGFYLTVGPNGALWLWPERTFELMAGALEKSLLPGEEMMDFEELLFSQAARLPLDKAGRVRLPERLLSLAGIEDRVVILGVRDHLELRNPEDWGRRRREKLARQGEIMLRARRALREQSHRARPEPGDDG